MPPAIAVPPAGIAAPAAPTPTVCHVANAISLDKVISLDPTESIVVATPFLNWEPIAAAGPVPARVGLKQSVVIKVFLGKCAFSKAVHDSIFFTNLSVFELALNGNFWSMVFTELVASGLLATNFQTLRELKVALRDLKVQNPANLLITMNHISPTESFDTPAVAAAPAGRGRGRGGRAGGIVPPVPAIPAVPGPPALNFLALVRMPELEEVGTALPLERLAFLSGVVGSHYTRASRADPRGMPSLVAAALAPALHRYLSAGVGAAPTDIYAATQLGGMLRTAIDAFSNFLEAPTVSSIDLFTELTDMVRFLNGSAVERAAVEAGRCFLISPMVRPRARD